MIDAQNCFKERTNKNWNKVITFKTTNQCSTILDTQITRKTWLKIMSSIHELIIISEENKLQVYFDEGNEHVLYSWNSITWGIVRSSIEIVRCQQQCLQGTMQLPGYWSLPRNLLTPDIGLRCNYGNIPLH